MLRLPRFEVARPRSVGEAVALLGEHGADAMIVAGGTDLLPNAKHRLVTPKLLVALDAIDELRGIREEADGSLVIGARTSLDEVSQHPAMPPVLAQATGIVASPQIRRMGTLGGNVMLDTRCRWYNQTLFWRQALGYCLKKDGTVCHVVAGGRKCVAAASNDSAPALMVLGATLVLEGPDGRRSLPVADFYKNDGIVNTTIAPGEVLVEVRVPPPGPGHYSAYGKLRVRGSIDFPLLGVAARFDAEGAVVKDAELVVAALQARPRQVKVDTLLGAKLGEASFDDAVERTAQQAFTQCRPLDNVPGDAEYRREMVPVYVRRVLHAAAAGEGPVS